VPKASRKDVEAARTLVHQRDQHRCLMCGNHIIDGDGAVHHRVAKGMGGSALLESPANLVTLCGRGNVDLCHGKVHGNPHWARNHGWIVTRSLNPAEIPVDTIHGWVYLDDAGSSTPCESPLLAEVGE
jgi:5-methylcytosine-specific restriction endonuclease McrA